MTTEFPSMRSDFRQQAHHRMTAGPGSSTLAVCEDLHSSKSSIFLKMVYFYSCTCISVCVCVCACVHMCHVFVGTHWGQCRCQVTWRQLQVTLSHLMWCWKLNSSPLQEQPKLRTSESVTSPILSLTFWKAEKLEENADMLFCRSKNF